MNARERHGAKSLMTRNSTGRLVASTIWSREDPLFIYSLCNSILLLPCVMVYYIASGLFLLFLWCPCMAINVNVQYNGGLLLDIILLTQCYFQRGTRLNAMKRFCICSL